MTESKENEDRLTRGDAVLRFTGDIEKARKRSAEKRKRDEEAKRRAERQQIRVVRGGLPGGGKRR